MSEKIGIHCFISGRVQGVWYRAGAQEEAKRLGLTGWARNLPDGRVEVQAFGDKAALQALHQWLHKGPERAEVTEVTYTEVPWENFDRFGIK